MTDANDNIQIPEIDGVPTPYPDLPESAKGMLKRELEAAIHERESARTALTVANGELDVIRQEAREAKRIYNEKVANVFQYQQALAALDDVPAAQVPCPCQ